MAKKATAKKVETAPAQPIRIDLGCGTKKREGFVGLDRIKFDGVDHVIELGLHRWPFKDGTVDEAFSSHTIEHLEWKERVHFFNELYRVLKKTGTAQIILPHWCSSRYYGDPTHKSAASEWMFHYLNKQWRLENAPHCDSEKAPGELSYSCDFDYTIGYSPHPALTGRSQDYVNHAFTFFKEAAQDMVGNLIKNR